MFVILEGFDKVGKTAVKKAFGKMNNWEQVIIDRGPAGYMFYDMIAERATEERTARYAKDMNDLIFGVDYVTVFLWSKPEDIIKRHHEAGEDCPFDKERYKEYQELYYDLCETYKAGGPLIAINTSMETLDETMESIKNFIENYKRTSSRPDFVGGGTWFGRGKAQGALFRGKFF